ncbi:SPOR domain-containing protein [Paraurantiacibacter namhicola]|uniref:Sporulation related domain protein n=1 Tax=Paraurantiacibacter namhicola TaxID=645517 RepID=A0A1C7DB82_9SPHN|nr:SPOR domain-containing protein [Paraurantiacibacter namhicola]ANU08677.1 Sporulation related domain protein [Paraurantiacibacter namhicola]
MTYAKHNRTIGLVATTAMAAVMLGGCATKAAPRAEVSASKAQTAMASGKHDSAIEHAEAAVMAEPRNPVYRVTLGNAYLEAGRFQAAATSFDDAMKLGDNSPRNALSLALALAGNGQMREAAAVLSDFEDVIHPADLGLAYALVGRPDVGIQVMSMAIRGGENTPKMRQNLAYTYALAGQWREARLMAAEDVPADQLDQRLGQWAQLAVPEAWQQRVAGMLGAPAGVRDMGQPVQLALANNPGVEQLAVEATGFAAADPAPQAVVPASVVPASVAPAAPQVAAVSTPVYPAPAARELPAVGQPVAPQAAPAVAVAQPVQEVVRTPQRSQDFETAFAAPAPKGGSLASAAKDSVRFVQEPVVQTLPVRQGAAPKPERAVAAKQADGTHLVQLGSFASEQGARRAWGIYVKRYPELADHQMVITQAVVRGKKYWRVSAAGFDSRGSASMCGKVKSNGQGCFAYAEGRPMPGAVDNGVRMAAR